MGTITEDYVSFEIAKLLKEKGFPLPSTNFRDWICCMYDENGDIQWGCYHPDYYCRVTIQMTMKWLREVHNIDICAFPYQADYILYSYNVKIYKDKEIHLTITDSKTYEQACETAIKYCLENLESLIWK